MTSYRATLVALLILASPLNDLVAVVRWIDRAGMDGFVKRLLAAVNAK